MEVADLLSISDPAVRAEEAVEAMQSGEDYIATCRKIRDDAIYALAKTGMKPFDIAMKLSLSKSQVVSVIRLAKAKENS